MPDGQRLLVADIFDALVATLEDTRMEPDLEEVLWGQVNLFHRATARIERSLDENEHAQRRLQGPAGPKLHIWAFERTC